MVKNIKIVFFGTSNFAFPVLKGLISSGYNVVGIFTSKGAIETEAKKVGLEVFTPTSLKSDEIFEQFKLLNPNLCVIAAYGKILPSRYLSVPKFGFLNIHPSLLPKYRGPSPVQTSILNGDPALQQVDAYDKTYHSLSDGAGTETGVTIMLMDDQIDHGPILAQKTYNLQPTTYNTQASEELFTLGGMLLVEILPDYINGQIKPIEQDHAQATYTKKFERKDGRIDWSRPAEQIHNQIRALNPEPGTWTLLRQGSEGQAKTLNIKEAVALGETAGEESGKVIKIDNDIAVATKTCYLILKQIQLEGGKVMDAGSFVNGHPDFLGSRLE